MGGEEKSEGNQIRDAPSVSDLTGFHVFDFTSISPYAD